MKKPIPILMTALNIPLSVFSLIILDVLLFITIFVPIFLTFIHFDVRILFSVLGQMLMTLYEMILLMIVILLMNSMIFLNSIMIMLKKINRKTAALQITMTILVIIGLVIKNPFFIIIPGSPFKFDEVFFIVVCCNVLLNLIYSIYIPLDHIFSIRRKEPQGSVISPLKSPM
jgi:hypothetical protein